MFKNWIIEKKAKGDALVLIIMNLTLIIVVWQENLNWKAI